MCVNSFAKMRGYRWFLMEPAFFISASKCSIIIALHATLHIHIKPLDGSA